MSFAKRLLPLFWAVLTVGVVAGVVWVGLQQIGPPTVAANAAHPAPSTVPAFLRAGHDYYVLVKLVEFNPKKPNGGSWDTTSAPDAKVLISWHGQQIFALPQREDQLISTWDLFRVNVMDIIRSGGSVDIASAINAPIVRVEPGEKITIEVRDADVIRDDVAMKVDLQLDELRNGENDIPPPRGSGLRRFIVQVIDRETSLSDLVALAGKR
ncbi:MAG: hypothetical protein JWM57_2081 [Phycisphaerales bacterium]|nr:hypothetical protein [Phycisphaerales bacterium]